MLKLLVLALTLFSKPAYSNILDSLVYNGTKSVDGEFPEVGWIGNCTATLVAPNVVFTASHCQNTGARISFKHRESGLSFPGTCTRHPQYNSNTVLNDWTFCILDKSVPEGSHMAQFDIAGAVKSGEKMLLNGFGKPNLVNHYWGIADVTSVRGQDIVTCGPAKLGSGDSGGSLFRHTETRTKGEVRKIVGVNSRAAINGLCSYYNQVTDARFVSFAKNYEAAKNVSLCGVSVDCTKPVEPTDCNAVYAELAGCLESRDAACKASYDKFKACI